MRSRRGRPRRTRIKLPERWLLILTEGEKTEVNYINYWYKANRSKVNIELVPMGSGPRQLVDEAVHRKREALQEQKRGRGNAYDEIWCVFDVDEHPKLRQAIVKARANNIRLAVSNPCIELWFLLHMQEQTAYIDRHLAQTLSKKFLKCDKSLTRDACEQLTIQFEDAKDRAQALDRQHANNGLPPGSNPSSNVWAIVDSIRQSQ